MSGYTLIGDEDLHWRLSTIMQIPNADFLERTGSAKLGVRLWRLPPMSAMTWHRHVLKEEFYFVLEGEGRMRVDSETLSVPKYGGVHVWPASMRQVFNDTDEDVLWLMVGAPEDELGVGEDASMFYPEDPCNLPVELEGKVWPPSR